MIRRLTAVASRLNAEAARSFASWATEMRRRSDSGEFGKWPWQDGYAEHGLTGRRSAEARQREARETAHESAHGGTDEQQ